MIHDVEGKLLVVREGYGAQRWSLPGGAVEEGETPEEAAAREALEETGIIVQIERLFGIYTFTDAGGTGQPLIVSAFRSSIVSVPAVPEADEITDVCWLQPDVISAPRSNILFAVVDDLVAGRENVNRQLRWETCR